jgi:uncharacterized protein YbjT (DUF2867 family)
MNTRTALIFGATGLVGNLLLEELVTSARYSSVKIFVRQVTGLSSTKVTEIKTDLTDIDALASELTGDDLFICLGTTIKKAGSVAAMEQIDRDLPVKIARTAFSAGVRNLAVVSSIGASAASANYYLRIKGEMEAGMLQTGFINCIIARPSMLLGERKERRVKELIGKTAMKTLQPLMIGKLQRYRAIHGRDVARAMIVLLNNNCGTCIVESDELQRQAAFFNTF